MPKPLAEELYHYTGIHGLRGIIESQTLWASHYQFLNDAEEVVHFQERLPRILEPIFTNLLPDFSAEGKEALRGEYGTIENALKQEPKKLARVMYKAIFANPHDDGISAEPFIASFCTIEPGNDAVANHGLLSQWRAYGAQGGYAIVFATEGLISLLNEEGQKWDYFHVFGGDVVYGFASDEAVRDEFGDKIDEIVTGWEKALRTHDSNDLDKVTKAFISCACRYKHWGFSEEKEFRFVCVPTPPKINELGTRQVRENRPRKPVSNFLRNGMPVPYLNLFEGIMCQSGQLPIRRIIVGPHPDKEKRKLAVDALLRQNNIHADVSVSAIPYLG